MVEFARKPLEGVFPLMPLCLTEEQEVDYDALAWNVDWLEERGFHGFISFGSMGQLYAPSEAEFDRVCDVCVDAADDIAVVISSTSPNTQEAIRRASYAEQAGADGSMLALPYALPLTEDLAVEFYRDVNDALDGELALMVYNYPPLTGLNITPDMWREHLLELDNIKAVKESNYGSPHHYDNLLTLSDEINFFPGSDNMFWPDSQLGAKGLLGIMAWVAPKAALRYYRECRNGNHHDPWTLEAYRHFLEGWAKIKRLPEIPMEGYEAAILNALVEIGGGRAGPPRKPYKRLPSESRELLEEAVQPLVDFEASV